MCDFAAEGLERLIDRSRLAEHFSEAIYLRVASFDDLMRSRIQHLGLMQPLRHVFLILSPVLLVNRLFLPRNGRRPVNSETPVVVGERWVKILRRRLRVESVIDEAQSGAPVSVVLAGFA